MSLSRLATSSSSSARTWTFLIIGSLSDTHREQDRLVPQQLVRNREPHSGRWRSASCTREAPACQGPRGRTLRAAAPNGRWSRGNTQQISSKATQWRWHSQNKQTNSPHPPNYPITFKLKLQLFWYVFGECVNLVSPDSWPDLLEQGPTLPRTSERDFSKSILPRKVYLVHIEICLI